MSDVKLFRTTKDSITEILGESLQLEKSLQNLIEANLEVVLGVRLLASEYTTGKSHNGRLDTLGIDENSCPVILEYKKAMNENVITQGLFYLDWLLDHKAEFKLLVIDALGREEADRIDWAGTRLLCVAADFKRYDEHAVQQINRNVELIRYKRFGGELLLLELVNAVSAKMSSAPRSIVAIEPAKSAIKRQGDKTVAESLASMSEPMRDILAGLSAFLVALGDDVQERQLSLYIAYKRLKNFVCVEIRREKLLLYLRLNPDDLQLEAGFSRDVRNIGHWGTGDLEVTIRSNEDVEKARAIILKSYNMA